MTVPTRPQRWLRWLAVVLVALATGVPAASTDAPVDNGDGIRMGVFPRHPAADTERMFQPLAAYLGERLGRKVTLEVQPDYRSFLEALDQDRYDLVHYNPYHYVRAHQQLGHRVVAMNEEHGETKLRAAIFVRENSPYRTLSDLRGRKILFGGDETALVSYLLPTDMLRGAGLRRGDYIEQFAQNPLKALIALHYRQGDAAAAGTTVPSMPLLRKTTGNTRLRTLAQSIALPQLPWAVSARVDPALLELIREALLELNHSHEGRAILTGLQLTAFRAANDHEYDIVRDIVRPLLDNDH